jgi:hypothetical protein
MTPKGWHGVAAIFVVAGITSAMSARAQDKPAGRPDFSGTWTLDSYLSDNPEQVAQEIRLDAQQSRDAELFGRGIERGRPGRIGGGEVGQAGRGGPERGQGRAADQISPEDRKKLNELTDAVQFASPTLVISQTDSDITIASTRAGTQALHPSGKVEKQQLNAGPVDRVARWEGPTLAVTYEVGHAGRLTYTYLLVPTTKQLLIRVNFERIQRQPGPFDIKLVYNRAGQP